MYTIKFESYLILLQTCILLKNRRSFKLGTTKSLTYPYRLVNYKVCEAYFKFRTTKKTSHLNAANKNIQRFRKLLNYAI